MRWKEKIEAFEKLGVFLEQFSSPGNKTETMMPWLEELNKQFFHPLESLIQSIHIHNPWFTEENIRFSLGVTGRSLHAEELVSWLSCYTEPIAGNRPRTVAVIMAGNIPLVGFHDMLCVLISGHNIMAKPSAKDDQLIKMMAAILCYINNDFEGRIIFEEGILKNFDAVIATGSNNTARYFEFYFGKYPNIIRKNRNSAAILDGFETKEDLRNCAEDVLRYFGLGCRSVSKLYVPCNYEFTPLKETFSVFSNLINHNQWANNYEYQKAIHLIEKIPHIDTGFMLIREDKSIASPISVLNYERVESTEAALEITMKENEKLQCIVGKPDISKNLVPLGKAQEPGLDDYADNIDTMEFLLNL